jgi:hypothetical protein
MRWPGNLLRRAAAALGAAAMMAGSPAVAKGESGLSVDPTAQIELRWTHSDLDAEQGEEFDSSGIALRGEAGLDFDLGKTTGARIEVEGSAFAYEDAARGDRTSYGGAIELRQDLSKTVELRLRVRRIENIALLEANSADQTSVGIRLQWQQGDERLRLHADYRWREYDGASGSTSAGWRLAGQYNHRFGSYHWLRFDLAYERIDSDDAPTRSYDRTTAKAEYSLPIAERLRFKPSVEYRTWSYDTRVAQGDPQGAIRKDSFVGPALELSYGREDRGFYAEANVQYRLRESNDMRFDDDAFRVGVTVGYRF